MIVTPTTVFLCRLLVIAGNSLAVIGCVSLILVATGLVAEEVFAFGISSGIRIAGSVAVAGCLFSAIGYGITDYFGK